ANPRAVDVLVDNLSQTDGRTAAAAATALTAGGGARAIEPLTALLTHRGPEARTAAIEALMALGGRPEVRDLNAMVIDDPDTKVRRAAADAPGTIPAPSAYEALAAASLGDKDPTVLQAAKTAFAKIPR